MATSTHLLAPPGPVADDGFRDLRARLQAFIARRVESREVAEDLAQEVLLRLLRADAADLTNPSAWLYRVARNVITDHYRTRRLSSIPSVPTAQSSQIWLRTPSMTTRRTRAGNSQRA